MTPSSLSKRIRNGGLLMLFIALGLGTVSLPQVYRLGGAIRQTLYNNYISIEAAQHMHSALHALQLAQRDGALAKALPANRDAFRHWIGVELNNITEARRERAGHRHRKPRAAIVRPLQRFGSRLTNRPRVCRAARRSRRAN